LYQALKSLGVIAADEVPNNLVLMFIQRGFVAPGDVTNAKEILAKLSRIADTEKDEAVFVAASQAMQPSGMLTPARVTAASAAQDGCVFDEKYGF
jgi:hypothetical protein